MRDSYIRKHHFYVRTVEFLEQIHVLAVTVGIEVELIKSLQVFLNEIVFMFPRLDSVSKSRQYE